MSAEEAKTRPSYELAQSQHTPNEWVVEAVGSDGEVLVAVFAGPAARSRAAEYADWKNSRR